ncbi:MAG: hypothetical protein JXP72_08090 [Coriobacteriia bacterium]|nr:hypothetical protein [Coriobacteriia bacterium]
MTPAAEFPRTPAARAQRVRLIVTVVVALALVAVGVLAALRSGLIGAGPGVAPEDLSRVALIAAAPDENGAVVAQVIVLVDLTESPPVAEALSPATPVTIPGTSYATLADAYPFGGGAGVANAIARAGKVPGDAPAYAAITPAALASAVDAAGGVRVRLPAEMAVFDGETLFTFRSGMNTLNGADLAAVFKGAPYLAEVDRAALDEELGRALVDLVAAWPAGLQAAAENADISTDMSAAALVEFSETLTDVP